MQKHRSHLKTSCVPTMLKTDAAWLAGFFDGEGSISKSRITNGHSKKKYTYWKLSIPNTSREALARVSKITGVDAVSKRKKAKAHYKQLWLWQTHATQEIRDIGIQILPYLALKEKIKRINSVLV